MEKLIKNTIIEAYCLRHCCQDTPKRAVHAEEGAASINAKVKFEDTEITDARNHRHVIPKSQRITEKNAAALLQLPQPVKPRHKPTRATIPKTGRRGGNLENRLDQMSYFARILCQRPSGSRQ